MAFTGKRVLVTGGAKGLGRAIVDKFVAANATVVVMDKNVEALAKLKSDLPGVTTVVLDMLDWAAVKVEMEKLGPLDVLINNAGVLSEEFVPEVSEEQLDFVFGINVKALVNTSQIFAKSVTTNGVKGACIVNISSVLDRKVAPGALAYCCSKAAVTMMTKCLAVELGSLGIRVNAVRPTVMRTTLFETYSDEAFQGFAHQFLENTPIPRLLEATETADLVLFLASPGATMITGEAVAVDGGYTIA